jgi:hypothetical protein
VEKSNASRNKYTRGNSKLSPSPINDDNSEDFDALLGDILDAPKRAVSTTPPKRSSYSYNRNKNPGKYNRGKSLNDSENSFDESILSNQSSSPNKSETLNSFENSLDESTCELRDSVKERANSPMEYETNKVSDHDSLEDSILGGLISSTKSSFQSKPMTIPDSNRQSILNSSAIDSAVKAEKNDESYKLPSFSKSKVIDNLSLQGANNDTLNDAVNIGFVPSFLEPGRQPRRKRYEFKIIVLLFSGRKPINK